MRFDTHKGLSHNQVNCFLKDRRGFLWIGTQAGLNRFDGYSFRIFRNKLNDSTSLANDYVFNLMEDPGGKIWVGDRRNYSVFDPKTEQFYRNADRWAKKYGLPDARVTGFLKNKTGDYWINHLQLGLCKYETRSGKLTVLLPAKGAANTDPADPVADFKEDSRGRLWIIRQSGLLEQLDPEKRMVLFRSNHLQSLNSDRAANFALFIDRDDDIWLFSEDLMGGHYFEQATRRFFAFNTGSSRFKLNNNIVRAITQDEQGLIWVATDHGGITLIDKQNKSVRYLLHDPDDEHSLSQNSAISMYRGFLGSHLGRHLQNGF
ncbi:MAG: hypothetical protein IPJ82_08990 [Lewinellaceae bacterium]|nr:hypothetical protein [Lewinellaceae bacterium]